MKYQLKKQTFLGCVLDETLSREPMALKVIKKLLQVLGLRKMLGNVFMHCILILHVP